MNKLQNKVYVSIPFILAIAVFGIFINQHHINQSVKISHLDIKKKAYSAPDILANKTIFKEVQTKIDKIALNRENKPVSKSSNLIIPGRRMKSAVFTPLATQALVIEGATLEVPEGALSSVKNISVTALLSEDLPPIPSEISNVTDRQAGYRFLPHGTQFLSPVTITLAYDESLIPEGFTPEDIFTLYFDETDQKWKALERDSIDHLNKLIVSNTLHFTDMINGIIKVPESPETGGYSPTAMIDIKAADPTSGINLMAPPSANSNGEAEMSFPLKVSGGRAGMSPQLSLQYSSAGSSSWVGFGWTLSVPGISVDASWGVPRYLPDKESETYLFAGSQLTPLAHRSEYVNRTSEKRFYPRIEGGFNKITRHGDNPSNYWWEVVSKDGSRNLYGGLPDSGVVRNAVVKDSKGNIGYWALTRSVEVHGNFIAYTYEKPEGCGEQLYLSEISYTGFENEPGPYKISFLRELPNSGFTRKDARIDARLGTITRDKDILRRVNISFNNRPIRSYTLQFKEGAFCKTLLESITELDANGNEFYTHTFDYYDDVQFEKGYVPFAPEKKLGLPDDDLKNPFLNPVNIFFDNISALGGSGSGGGSGSLALTVGFNNFKLWDKSLSAGGNGGYSGSTGESFLTLTDINGDGLTDKVFKKDGRIYYRPNIMGSGSSNIFGEARLVKGISYISLSKTNAYSWGLEANPPSSFVGYSNSKSKTKTEIYFSDFNGDGLVDLAKKGVVYFNHIDENGDPVFSPISSLTPNPLYTAGEIDSTMLPSAADEQKELEAQFPLQDAVRMWQAPYSGWVKIDAPVNLIDDTSTIAKADTMKDGVKVSIQHNNNVKWFTEIAADDYIVKPVTLNALNVNKNDRIYFRVQSRFNGSGDQVKWDPEITYTNIAGPDTLLNWIDINGKRIARYKASEDFLLCGMQSVGMPKDGKVRLLTKFSKGFTTDNIKVEIIRTDTFGVKTSVYTRLFSDTATTSLLPVDMDVQVLKDETYLFRVSSSTNIDWKKINWDIYFEYISIDDGTPVMDKDGKPSLSFKSVPEYVSMYNNPIRHSLPVIVDSAFLMKMGLDSLDNFPHSLKITPVINYNVEMGNLIKLRDTVILSVKTRNRFICKKEFHYLFEQITNFDTLKADVILGDTLYFEYHFRRYDIIKYLNKADVVCHTESTQTINASVYSIINPDHEIFGKLYRGWGQFNYDGSGERMNAPIDQGLLKLNTQNSGVEVGSSDELDGKVHNTLGDPFVIAIPYAVKGYFLGADEQVYISPDIISSSRRGEKNIYVAPIQFNGSGLIVFDKITEDVTKSVSVGGGVGPASGSGSKSWGTSTVLKDMTDMNGDRYPDLLSNNNIQYTNSLGTIVGKAVTHSLGAHSAESYAEGGTLGGSFVTAKFDNAMKSCGKGNNKVKISMGDNLQMDKNAKASENTAK